jgi:hypothetical protein
MLKQEESNESDCQDNEERYVQEDMRFGLNEFFAIIQKDCLQHQSLLIHNHDHNQDDKKNGDYY